MRKSGLAFYTSVAAISLVAGFLLSALFLFPTQSTFSSGASYLYQKGDALVGKVEAFAESASMDFFGGAGGRGNNAAASVSEDEPEGERKIDLGHVLEKEYDLSSEDTAVVANLEDMTLTLYKNGEMVEEMPILSKGRPGSPWETPAGKYEVLYKESNHFSSIGEVYMPSSVQFFGNFFIHGWPYYPDGTPVPEGYSGGCIRLSEEEASRVFDFVENGTPVIVHSETKSSKKSSLQGGHYLIDTGKKPDVDADSYLVADLDTGEVILEKARRQVRPIASITKLMTALVSLEVVNQYQEARVSPEAVATEGFAGGLVSGERISTGELIYPLLLESSNDAAEVTARHYGRDHFIKQMNNKASSVGLENTFFEDPSGLSSFNVSNAEDLFLLAEHIYKNKIHIFDITKLEDYEGENHFWRNNSRFLGHQGFIGGKNGFTDEAGKTQLALFSMPLAEFENRNIGIVLLSTDDVERDMGEMIDFLKEHVFYKSNAVATVSR